MKNKILFVGMAIIALLLTVGAAVAQEAPVITSTPSAEATVGQEYTYQITHTDPDSGLATYEVTTGPAGMDVTASGLVTWTPTSAGTVDVTVEASDDNSTDSQNFQVTSVAVPATFEAGNVNLGSSTQKRDVSESDTWTITNTGSNSITNIELSIVGVSDEYSLVATLPATTLSGGESMDVVFDYTIPDDQDSGVERLGTIQVSGTGANTISKEINLEVENNLVIDKIEVEVDGNKDTLNSPGEVDDEAEYGDDIEITVVVENTFDEDIEIEDIDIELEADDLDPADGLDDSISSIKDGKDDEVTFSFTMDIDEIDADDAPFTITVTVRGEDENGAIHEDEWDIEIDMDVNSRDVRFVDFETTAMVLACGDNTVNINYELRNVGTRDLDEAMVKIEVEEVDAGVWERDIELDEGDNDDFTTLLRIPSNTEPGIYFVDITAYSTDSTSDDTDSEAFTIEVQDCSGNSDDDNQNDEDNEPIDVTPTVPVEVTGTPVATSTGKSSSSLFGDADTYTLILGILVVILLIVVVIMGIKLLNK